MNFSAFDIESICCHLNIFYSESTIVSYAELVFVQFSALMIIFLFYKNAEREQSFVLSLTIAHEILKKNTHRPPKSGQET